MGEIEKYPGIKYPPSIIPPISISISKEKEKEKEKYPERIKAENQEKRFPTYLDEQYLTPRLRILCEIVAKTEPVSEINTALENTGITPTPELVENVLRLSYGSPAAAVGFFRWAGFIDKPSVYAWNLMVDLLGKNEMFEEMWDAIRSMRDNGDVSLATFASVFGSYCAVGKYDDAIMSFDVMDKYGVEIDVVALNTLLSAFCGSKKQTKRAYGFFNKIKEKIAPDGDTFTILLEGWESQGNVAKAKTTFGEMVVRIGWDAKNMAAYNAFLMTLVRGSQVADAVKFLQVMKGKGCLPGLKFFSNALDILVKQNESTHAVPLWEAMVGSGIMPNLITFNAMIDLLCKNNDIYNAFRFLDDMPFYGVFPDSLTYNLIFKCLINNKKVREAASFFKEMTKNECPPTQANCAGAIEMFFDQDDPESGFDVWNFVLDNKIIPYNESTNALLIGLCKLGRLSELTRCANEILDWRIRISEVTMDKMQKTFCREGRNARETYGSLERRWRASYIL